MKKTESTEKAKRKRKELSAIERRELNRIKVQIDMLKAYTAGKPRGYGFCVDTHSVYFMVGTEVCYKIPVAKFLLDPKKLPKTRLIKLGMYKDLFEHSKPLKKVHRRKKIRDESFAVFRSGDKQICVPAERLDKFGWKEAIFCGIDEYSPVFILEHNNEWSRVLGFVMPVEVSVNVLKKEENDVT